MASPKRSDFSTISELARRFDMHASAIRYYESIGLLPHVARRNGQRAYDEPAIQRLSIIAVGRRAGLSLDEIRDFLAVSGANTPPGQRWRALTERKIAELEDLKAQLSRNQDVLRRLGRCKCTSLEECGSRLRQRLEQ